MLSEVLFATYRTFPAGSVAAAAGPVFAANGEPLTAVKIQFFALTENAETLAEPEFATYKNAPLGVTAVAAGFVPVRA